MVCCGQGRRNTVRLELGSFSCIACALPPSQYKPKRAPARSSQYRPLTQAELLAEAARTEIENTKSLEASRVVTSLCYNCSAHSVAG